MCQLSTVHFLELVLKFFFFVVAIILFFCKNIWTFNLNCCGFWMSLTACTVHLLVRFSFVIYGSSCNLGYTNKITDHTLYNNTFIYGLKIIEFFTVRIHKLTHSFEIWQKTSFFSSKNLQQADRVFLLNL